MLLRALPLSALRAFEAAARHLNCAAAARELGVTPAAVSLQVRSLEARLGRPLFVRRKRKITLSDAGVKLAEPLTELFAQMAAVVADVSAYGVASLEVTAMPSFATKWLAARLARFSVAHPDCRVRLAASDELADFRSGGPDVGLRYGPGGYKGLHAERIMDVIAFPVCTPEFAQRHAKHLKTPSELVRAPLLHDETSLIAPGLPAWPGWFDAAGVRNVSSSRNRMIFESAYLAVEAALAGQGVALGLSPLVSEDLKAKRLVRLFDIAIASPFAVWFACRRERLKEPRISQFRDWLLAETRLMSAHSADER